jgi:LPXTG-site transpeptidase (sortase) family protein
MNRIDWKNVDRPLAAGAAIAAVSLVGIIVGLVFVVRAATDDPVDLPEQGTIEDILDESSGDSVNGDAPEPDVPQGPKPVRLALPRLFIDAPVEATGFEPGTNNPDVPKRADLVAWYKFTPTPGMGTNAVFAGHVDWQTPEGSPIPGVFYRLRELKIGDDVTVKLEDGKKLTYRVTGNIASDYNDPKLVRLMGSTRKDVITLITCGGSWVADGSSDTGGNYSHRVIVRAERVEAAAAAP